MMEMVHDIKDEFKMILDEVKWMDEGDFSPLAIVFLFQTYFDPLLEKIVLVIKKIF